MKKALQVLNKMVVDGVASKYVIGGSVAALYYLEPFMTEDCDVFVSFSGEGLGILSPIYGYFMAQGFKAEGPYINVDGVLLQILPITTSLVQEAFDKALSISVEGVPTNIFSLEYLMAICVQVGRPKDKIRELMFMEQAVYDSTILADILVRHNLLTKWESWLP